jgi:biopolymer transport protein ExbB/TolQ
LDKSFSSVALETIGWPVLWGSLACGAFYLLIFNHIIETPLVTRYFASHPVLYVETALFCVGLAALLLKLTSVTSQLGSLSQIQLPPRPEGGQRIVESASMLHSLRELPSSIQRSYLARRLDDALEYVRRKGTSLGLDQELKHLADLDAARQQEGYSLVRIVVWAIPMLGFLGTVIGITMALAELSPQALVATPEQAMEGLLAGLAVAFDTTALALSLSVVLMFGQFLTSRVETVLLEGVDERVGSDLVGRFEELGTQSDPTLAALKQLTDQVVASMDEMVQKQADIWVETISAAQSRWKQLMDTAGSNVGTHMIGAMQSSLEKHADELIRQEDRAGERAERHWKSLQQALTENARVMQSQQSELVRQGDTLLRMVEQADAISRLQQSLGEGLSSLTATSRLEETMSSLGSAIHLLNSRLGAAADPMRRPQVYSRDTGGRRAA